MTRESGKRHLGRGVIVTFVLVALVLAVFGQVALHDFVNYDDGWFVTENPNVTSGVSVEGCRWAFSCMQNYWTPLARLSHMLDCEWFGLNPAGHHLTNLVLHVLNVLLLFGFLRSATGSLWKSALVAALFAVHPLNVETVAWVTERKGLLSTLFMFLALAAHVRYGARPSLLGYGEVFLLFVVSLMSKPMAVTFPILLLILDVWPLGRFPADPVGHGFGFSWLMTFLRSKVLLEKAPFFLASAVFCLLTLRAEEEVGAIPSLDVFPMGLRIPNALVSYVTYGFKAVWPTGLAAFYPYPDGYPLWQAFGSAGLLALGAGMAWRLRKSRPWLLTGCLWFLVSLFPVIGLVAVGSAAMADRYAYVSLIGLFIAAVWMGSDLISRWPWTRTPAWVMALVVLGLLSGVSWRQAGHWRDSETLFCHVISVTRGNFLAHNNLGMALFDQGEIPEAIRHFETASTMKPDYHRAKVNLGGALAKAGRYEEAEKVFRDVLEAQKDDAETWSNLGLLLALTGRLEEGEACLGQALSIRPEYAKAHYNLGVILSRQGRWAEAESRYREALRLQPEYARAHNDLGAVLLRLGRVGEAARHFEACIAVDPGCMEARRNRARLR